MSGTIALERAGPARSRSGVASAASPGHAPATIVLAPPLVAGGVALLAWDYASLPDGPARDVAYWLALGLIFGGTWLGAAVGRPRFGRQAIALLVFGVATWLPYLLRSPDRLLFIDERYHLDVLTRMATMATTQLEPRLYALPGSFPGLELLTLTLMSWTGAPALVATRLVTLVLHAMIPVLALAIARGLGLPGRLAAIAALVYAANTSYLFFHSVYSYETLGITLFLGAWVVVVAWLREPVPIASRLLIGAVPLVAGLTVTHHLSSYLLVACLALASLVVWRRRDRRARALGVLTGIAAALAVGWFVVNVGFLGPYLAGTLADRVGVILETLVADRSQPRSLFANSPLPVADRVVAILYPILVFSTSAAGLLAGFLLRRRGHLRSPAWIVLAVVGPVAWLASTPAVVTRGAELAYRSWPFLFLGVAPIAALGIGAISGWLGRRQGMGWAVAARGVAPILVALLLAGGFVIGDNQAGRFPVDRPMTAAGPANVTDDVLAAARWLRATAGEDHIVATDSGSAVTFSTDGGQRILRWNDWYPFITPDVDKVLPFLLETHTEFLVVDLQVTELPPRYGAYYGPPAIPPDRDPGQPIPAALLFRLDDVPGLERIYDGGRVRIYAVTSATGGGR